MENLLCNDFTKLDLNKQIEILIKSYFLIQSEKGNVELKLIDLENQIKNLEKSEEQRYSALIEKFKNEAYSFKCERDDLKIKASSLKSKNDKLTLENEKLQEKITKNKEKFKQFENKKERFEIDKKEIENKLKKSQSELTTIKEMFKNEIDILNIKINELNEENTKKTNELSYEKEKLKVLEQSLKELRERNDYLEVICKSSIVNNQGNILEDLGINESMIMKNTYNHNTIGNQMRKNLNTNVNNTNLSELLNLEEKKQVKRQTIKQDIEKNKKVNK